MGHYFTKSNHYFPIFDPIGANSNSKKKQKNLNSYAHKRQRSSTLYFLGVFHPLSEILRDKQQIHPPTEKSDKITCLKADLLLIEKLSYYVLFEWLKLDLNDTHVSTNNLVFSKYER